MFRQSPRKNGRNKGVKVKHVVQISLLLGVSIWLLYQVHHSDDKKVSVTTNVNKLRIVTLGRKDLRPKVKETDVNDGKETEERESDEPGIEKEDEEVARETESEEREVMKHEEVGENERVDDHDESDEKDDGGVKTTKKGNDERIKVEKNNGGKGRGRSGVKNEKIQTEGEGMHREDLGSKKEATKEEKGSEKGGEKEQGNKVNKKENKKENVQLRTKESKKKDEGGKEMKEVHKSDTKEHKQSDGTEEIKGKVNKDKINDQNKVVVAQKSSMTPHPKEVEMSSSSEDHDQSVRDEIENVVNEKESVEDKTIPDSYSAPSFESETTSSMKNDSDIEGQDKEQISNDDVSVLEEEKDALTDLGTLPEAETGGSISHDDAATE